MTSGCGNDAEWIFYRLIDKLSRGVNYSIRSTGNDDTYSGDPRIILLSARSETLMIVINIYQYSST